MRHSCGCGFIDEASGPETFKMKALIDLVRFVPGDGVSEYVTGTGRCLETAGTPAAIDIKPLYRRLCEDR